MPRTLAEPRGCHKLFPKNSLGGFCFRERYSGSGGRAAEKTDSCRTIRLVRAALSASSIPGDRPTAVKEIREQQEGGWVPQTAEADRVSLAKSPRHRRCAA